MNKRLFAELRKRGTAGMALAVLLVSVGASHTQTRAPRPPQTQRGTRWRTKVSSPAT